ncbi:MAG: sigma-54 dependent transcriptional regulator [Halioglobus sp.]
MTATCLIYDSDTQHAEQLSVLLAECGFSVTCEAALTELDDETCTSFDLVILDLEDKALDNVQTMLEQGIRVGTEYFVMSDLDEPELADQAVRMGASYYFCKPVNEDNLRPLLADIAAEADTPAHDTDDNECTVDQFGLLRGNSRSMRKLYRQIRKVAQSDISVMVVGESGTGKELVANTIHLMSGRRDGPYVAFNCAAVPESLAESELFGHERGAFSGATQRHRGFFERAKGGTLLLDEITEMNSDLQSKLLRVLETRQLRRLGSEQDIALDVRVISACNRDPATAVQEGTLREDLYYRLAQFPLQVPALRHRGNDVLGLARFFLNELNEKHDTNLTLSDKASEAIENHDWPGNVRELRHRVERAYIMSETTLDDELIHAISQGASLGPVDESIVSVPVGTSIADMERVLIEATLKHTDDDKPAAAELLGISVKTLYNRLRDYQPE